MILHKVATSPFTDSNLQQCLKHMQPTDKLLLIQDGVYAMLNTGFAATLQSLTTVYLLQEDVEARGLTIKNEIFQGVSYSEFVDLSLSCKQVISW